MLVDSAFIRRRSCPSAASFIVEGLRVSGPFALVSAVTAEMFSSNRGMGYLLIRSSTQFDTAGVFACIVVLMIMGILPDGSDTASRVTSASVEAGADRPRTLSLD